LKTLVVIPARYGSTRFPGKPLAQILGKSLVQRVYEQCLLLNDVTVVIATDDTRIVNHCKSIDAASVMTSLEHQSGTNRVAEVAAHSAYIDCDFIINVQGDEPCILPEQIKAVIDLLKNGATIATLKKAITATVAENPNVVKVVTNNHGRSLYFSRACIPFQRNQSIVPVYFKHIGIYGFARKTLLEVAQLPMGLYENMEQLEQLRWLENGFEIACATTAFESPAVDVPEDIQKVEAFLKQ